MSLTKDDVNLLRGHAEFLRMEGKTDMPAAFDRLALTIERHIAAGQPKPAGAVPLPEPEWLTLLRKELFLAAMKSNFTLTRDELQHLINLGDAREAAGRAAAVSTQIVGWVHEDQLPEGYPYDAMFPHSKVDGVRMFPVFAPIPQQPAAEGDDIAVDRFAEAMKEKMAAARAKGRGGWEGPTCNADILSRMLRDHVEKGDPRDVANFCMMLWNRGEAIQASPTPAAEAGGVTEDERVVFERWFRSNYEYPEHADFRLSYTNGCYDDNDTQQQFVGFAAGRSAAITPEVRHGD